MTDIQKQLAEALEQAESWIHEHAPKYIREDVKAALAAHRQQEARGPLTDQEIIDLARAAGLDLEPTRNRLFEVRGQHAQLINFARSIEGN